MLNYIYGHCTYVQMQYIPSIYNPMIQGLAWWTKDPTYRIFKADNTLQPHDLVTIIQLQPHDLAIFLVCYLIIIGFVLSTSS